jgi:hypothetical protein
MNVAQLRLTGEPKVPVRWSSENPCAGFSDYSAAGIFALDVGQAINVIPRQNPWLSDMRLPVM